MQMCWKVFIIFLIVSSCAKDNYPNNAVVVTRHHLATDVGANILREGGNAVDSAIAVSFALENSFFPFTILAAPQSL